MKFFLATKEYMTQVFDEKGVAHAVTVLSATPMTVTQVKTQDKDGYAALQVGVGTKRDKHIHKAQKHLGGVRYVKEFRPKPEDSTAHEKGASLAVSEMFAPGDIVSVSGIAKAKGFQGGVKRYGFAGGPRSHGQKHNERAPGSIGGGLRNRVPKGMRMPGRTGGRRATVTNLKVILVDAERNQLFVEGAVPGRRGTLIEVRGK